MKQKNAVQIIYLNGPSSSGKTTFAKAIQEALETPFLHIGIDKIIGWMPEKINNWTGGSAPLGYSWHKRIDETGHVMQELMVGPYAKKITKTFQQIVVLLAKEGYSLIIDDVSFGKNEVNGWREILKDFSVLWVGVVAPLPVLEERENERSNRILGSARAQFYTVHNDVTYDITINTHDTSLTTNLQKIFNYI